MLFNYSCYLWAFFSDLVNVAHDGLFHDIACCVFTDVSGIVPILQEIGTTKDHFPFIGFVPTITLCRVGPMRISSMGVLPLKLRMIECSFS